MCNEYYWRERRRQREQESREVWLDFERNAPVDAPVAPDEEPDVTRLEQDEVAASER
jgi:hypothetical protein